VPSGGLSFDSLLSQVFGQASAAVVTQNPETTVAIRIIGRIQAHVFGRWRESQRQGIGCALHFAPPGETGRRCGQPMIGLCSVCERPVCLGHCTIHVETGTPVCLGCIELARNVAARGSCSQAAPSSAGVDPAKLRRKYLRRLKLKGQPTEAEILAAFKREAARTHPDRATESRKAAATKRFKELGLARDWLLDELKHCAA